MLAVPLAAMIWTLPLQLGVFGQMPTYSILAQCFGDAVFGGGDVGRLCQCDRRPDCSRVGGNFSLEFGLSGSGFVGIGELDWATSSGGDRGSTVATVASSGAIWVDGWGLGLHHFRPRYRIGCMGWRQC